MQFDVKIRKVIENGKPLKALASVTVDGSFTIHNVRVIKTENAQFVAMPYARICGSNSFADYGLHRRSFRIKGGYDEEAIAHNTR